MGQQVAAPLEQPRASTAVTSCSQSAASHPPSQSAASYSPKDSKAHIPRSNLSQKSAVPEPNHGSMLIMPGQLAAGGNCRGDPSSFHTLVPESFQTIVPESFHTLPPGSFNLSQAGQQQAVASNPHASGAALQSKASFPNASLQSVASFPKAVAPNPHASGVAALQSKASFPNATLQSVGSFPKALPVSTTFPAAQYPDTGTFLCEPPAPDASVFRSAADLHRSAAPSQSQTNYTASSRQHVPSGSERHIPVAAPAASKAPSATQNSGRGLPRADGFLSNEQTEYRYSGEKQRSGEKPLPPPPPPPQPTSGTTRGVAPKARQQAHGLRPIAEERLGR